MESAAQYASLGSRGRRAVGLSLVASGAGGIIFVLTIFAPFLAQVVLPDWLSMLASGAGNVPGAVFILPVCGALLTRVDRPWRRRAGWAGITYAAFVAAAMTSGANGVPWSEDAFNALLFLGVYAVLPLDVAVFVLSIFTGVALLRTRDEPDGIAVRRLSPRSIVYGSLAIAGLALVVFALTVYWPR